MSNPYRAGYPEKKAVVTPHYGAGVVTNPYMLPVVISTNHLFVNSGGTAVALHNGVPPDHNGSLAITGTTEVTLFSVTGSGFLYDIITPNGLSGSPHSAAIITITVDGVATVISTTAVLTNSDRLFIGAMIDTNGTNARILGLEGKHPKSTSIQVPAIIEVDSKCMARLRFERSLTVSIRMTAIPAVIGTDGNKAMWRYRFD